jgi:hypothetical protein
MALPMKMRKEKLKNPHRNLSLKLKSTTISSTKRTLLSKFLRRSQSRSITIGP